MILQLDIYYKHCLKGALVRTSARKAGRKSGQSDMIIGPTKTGLNQL